MIGFVIYQPSNFVLILLVPILLFLFFRANYKRKKSLKRLFPFREEFSFNQLNSIRKWKMLLVCLALLFVVFALVRPAWNLKKTESIREGRDIVILLDVSRSMLAEDVFPNRLESAKDAIVEFSEELKGDRIAMVVFAGASQIVCPLTFDYNFFEDMVSQIDWQSASVGGTSLSQGLTRVTDDLLTGEKQADVDIIVISDGGDTNKERLDSLGNFFLENNIHLITIGIGNPNLGSLIPEAADFGDKAKSYVRYKGEAVSSILEAETLKTMAKLSKGVYVESGTNSIDLLKIYKTNRQSNTPKQYKGSEITSFKEQFQWFLAFAIALLFIALAIPRKIRNKTFSFLLVVGAVAFSSCKSSPTETNKSGRDLKRFFNEGVEHYQKEEFAVARSAFTTVFNGRQKKSDKAKLAFNIGNCFYKQAFNIEPDDEEEFDIHELMLTNFIESERFYRIALELDSSMTKAWYNFEVVRMNKLKLLEEIEREKRLSRQTGDPVREILNLLKVEKEMQRLLNSDFNKINPNSSFNRRKKARKTFVPNLQEQKKCAQFQKQLMDTTQKVLDKIWLLEAVTDSLQNTIIQGLSNDTSYKVPVLKMDSVLWLQESLSESVRIGKNFKPMSASSKLTIDLLQQTIDFFNENFKQDPNMPEGNAEPDDSESLEASSDDSDDNYSESKSMSNSEPNKGRQMEGFPPPNVDAQEILSQEKKINQKRGKKASKYKSVEKDW